MVAKSIRSLSEPRISMPLRQYAALLAKYLRPQMRLVVGVAVLLFSNIALQLVNPQILRYFIDEALAGSPIGRLITAAVLFTVIALVQQAVNVIATYTSGRVGWKATNALRADLARHCLSLDMSFHNNQTPGEMIERIDGDANELGGFFSTFVIRLLGNAILLVGVLALLFREDWRAGLALSVFATVMLLALSRMRNITVAHWKSDRDASTNTFGFIEERLSGREEIGTNAAKAYVMRRLQELFRIWFRKRLKAGLMRAVVMNTASFMFRAGNAAALGIGAYLFIKGHITIGAVYLIFHYTDLLRMPIESMTRQLNSLQQATASLVRIHELFSNEKTVLDSRRAKFPTGELSVRFDNVSFGYENGDSVLHDIEFDLQPGKVLGLLGRTGSGKTTLARLLVRLHDTDQGGVFVGEDDVREYPVFDLRERIAVVPQDVRLFHGSLRDNLTFYDETVGDERLLEVIDDLGLMTWYRSLPDGLDTQLQSEGGGLSTGEAQLLAFARVFLKDPRVVVLDEATSRLDRSTEQLIEGALSRLVEGRTVIIIAHHLASVERCDDIMIIEEGRIIEHGERVRLGGKPDSHFHRLLQTGMEEMLA